MDMSTRKVAVALVGIPERLHGALNLVFERSRTSSTIHYVLLAEGGKTDALLVLLGQDLKAPDASRWGASVAAMIPLADVIDGAVRAGQGQAQSTSFSDIIHALDGICLRHFASIESASDPVSAGNARHSADSSAAFAAAWPTRAFKRSNILLVTEGHRIVESAFERMAQDEIDFEVVESPGEALEKSALDRFDLAILDVDTLEGQAYSLCRELTQRRGDGSLRVVLMGQRRGMLEQWRGRWAGSEGLIPGPDEPDGFRAGVARVLHR
jgi:PleD family two-component response regulator